MRFVRLVCVLGSLLAIPTVLTARQDHHSNAQRGAAVMGFDQQLTVHQFLLFADGGAIDVSVKDPADDKNRAAIHSHLPHITAMFAAGDFEAPMLVHDSKNVPGTAVMATRKDRIRYEYVETPSGGRVNITSADPEAVAAVHAFLKFQIADHRTGDQPTVRKR